MGATVLSSKVGGAQGVMDACRNLRTESPEGKAKNRRFEERSGEGQPRRRVSPDGHRLAAHDAATPPATDAATPPGDVPADQRTTTPDPVGDPDPERGRCDRVYSFDNPDCYGWPGD